MTIASPGNDKVPPFIHRYCRVRLTIGGVGINLKFAPLSYASTVVALSIYPTARPVLTITSPGNDKVPPCIHRYCRVRLTIGGVGIDLKFAPLSHPGTVVALGIYPIIRSVLTIALPGNNKIPRSIYRYCGIILKAAGIGIDFKFAPLSYASTVVALSIYPIAIPILIIALPGNNKIPRSIHRYCGVILIVAGGRIDLKFAPLSHPSIVVALGIYPITRPVLTIALPGNNKVPI